MHTTYYPFASKTMGGLNESMPQLIIGMDHSTVILCTYRNADAVCAVSFGLCVAVAVQRCTGTASNDERVEEDKQRCYYCSVVSGVSNFSRLNSVHHS